MSQKTEDFRSGRGRKKNRNNKKRRKTERFLIAGILLIVLAAVLGAANAAGVFSQNEDVDFQVRPGVGPAGDRRGF